MTITESLLRAKAWVKISKVFSPEPEKNTAAEKTCCCILFCRSKQNRIFSFSIKYKKRLKNAVENSMIIGVPKSGSVHDEATVSVIENGFRLDGSIFIRWKGIYNTV